MEDVAKDYVAGTAAGVAMVITGHPFDTVKVKLQTQTTETFEAKYRGAIQCTIHTLRHEGIKGFYKGATSSFVGMALESSLLFGVYSQLKTFLQGSDLNTPRLFAVVPSAAFAGAAVSFILCPTELVKCRLQVRPRATNANIPDYQRYSGPLDCIQKTLKQEGIHGLFRGWSATVYRESIGNAVFFTTYELMRSSIFGAFRLDRFKSVHVNELVNSEDEIKAIELDGSPIAQVLSEAAVGIFTGGIAGIAFWTTTLPFDVVKTRIQTTTDLNESRSFVRHVLMIHRELGVKGLYAGFGPTLARAFPTNAAAIVSWELCAKYLGIRHQTDV